MRRIRKDKMMKKPFRKIFFVVLFAAIMMIPGTVYARQPKVLVAYFSVTGNTKTAAKKVRKATGGKLYRIRPQKAYTDADISYEVDDCRANVEQEDDSCRPQIKGKVKKMKSYDVIFVGYPIWWGKEPKVVKTFLESYDFKGKVVVPFCTSGSSGISGSMKGIRQSAAKALVLKGKDLTDASQKSINSWAKRKMTVAKKKLK